MRPTGKHTEAVIRKQLESWGSRTIPQLVKRTGLSYNAVKAALDRLGAIADEESYPAKWHLGALVDTVRAPRLAQPVGDLDIVISISTYNDWVPRWNGYYKRAGESLQLLGVDESSDPEVLSADLAAIARSTASMAFALQQVMNKPDWYQILSNGSET